MDDGNVAGALSIQPENAHVDAASKVSISFEMSNAMVVESEPRGAAAESIHALRTHLVARHVEEGRRGLVVCETGQAGGVFLAANLAMSFAEAGVRTLLIDGDLRRPRLASFITPSCEVLGLKDAIEQPELPIGAAIQSISRNFSVMYAGDSADRAQELLTSNRLLQIADLCMRDFDMTISTTAPANYYADARRFASVLRYVLVVARRDVTFVNDMKALVNELTSDGARVVGTVYNDF